MNATVRGGHGHEDRAGAGAGGDAGAGVLGEGGADGREYRDEEGDDDDEDDVHGDVDVCKECCLNAETMAAAAAVVG